MPTRDLKQTFDEQGYVILKQVISRDIIDHVIDDMKKLVEERAQLLVQAGRISDTFLDEPFTTRMYRLYEHHLDIAPKAFRRELHVPGMFPLLFHPQVLDVIEAFLGEEVRLYPNYTVRPKFPEWAGTQVLWHQDGGYTEAANREQGVDQLRMVNVWTPFVPATVENGCMQFIPGTHKLGVVPHVGKQFYLEIEDSYIQPRLEEAINVILDPGDIVLFHNLLFHRGQPNVSGQIRWSADWRYQDATQPTLRPQQGHLARSRSHPEDVVNSAEQWARLTFE
ncbi:MAG: hypothetical protein K0Q59_2183 [Paenibacillus sp.]|nr:hypothetical protein [Paenibacillus sp.]